MKKYFLLLALSVAANLPAIASPQSEGFAKTGFSKEVVTGCLIKKVPLDDGDIPTVISSKDFLDSIVDALTHIESPKTKSADFTYKIGLLAIFSGTLSELDIFINEKGDGYFQRASEPAVYFYSPSLAAIIKTEQGAAANP